MLFKSRLFSDGYNSFIDALSIRLTAKEMKMRQYGASSLAFLYPIGSRRNQLYWNPGAL